MSFSLGRGKMVEVRDERVFKVMRLQKWMAEAGVASRRESERLIQDGYVQVNNEVVRTLGVKVDPQKDRIEVKGERIHSEKKRTFLFYKPSKVITSMIDPQGRKVVADFFQHVQERVYPVGRLDYDTEGLLIVTNDGELANYLMHPRHKVKKTYLTMVKGKPSMESLKKLACGIKLKDGITAPARIHPILLDDKKSKVEITIHEGRNRQVRRMFDAIGHPVVYLRRIQYGFLKLKGLNQGEFRELTENEVRRLKEGT